ncbi:hypothetical protein LPJ57_000919 [Coemansia sp. RSA 486]|nr:hypothetical protein LPJ57_000919 [Coemansia sp. RSA 486]KAJ2233753.1 hypothetical protein IWW45_003940 [Coemansia sp. RSA 485]
MKLTLQIFVFVAPALASVMTFTHGKQPLATLTNKNAGRQVSATMEPLALIEPADQVDVPTADDNNSGEPPAVFSATAFSAATRRTRGRRPRTATSGVSVAAQVVAKSVTAQVTVDSGEKEAEQGSLESDSVALQTESGSLEMDSPDFAKSLSQVLVDSSTGLVAGEDFSSILLSAIESASGDLPVIGI